MKWLMLLMAILLVVGACSSSVPKQADDEELRKSCRVWRSFPWQCHQP
jgi:hypothetical protein